MERKDRFRLVGAFAALLLLLIVCACWGFLWSEESSAASLAPEPSKLKGAKGIESSTPHAPTLLSTEPKNVLLEQMNDGSWMALFPARTLRDPSRFQSLEYLVVPEKGEKTYEGLAVVPPMGWKVLSGVLNAGYPIVELRWTDKLGQTVRRSLSEVFPAATVSVQGNVGVLLNQHKNSNETQNANLPPDGAEILIAVHLCANISDAAWQLWE